MYSAIRVCRLADLYTDLDKIHVVLVYTYYTLHYMYVIYNTNILYVCHHPIRFVEYFVAAGGPAMGPHMGDEAGRPWGQKIGSNDKYNEWKLFIGQVPLEV